MVWLPFLVALPEHGILVLHFVIDVKVLSAVGKAYLWPKPRRCPACGSTKLWGHGYAGRYFEGFSELLWVKRFRCDECNAIHTCRPWGYLKGFRYPSHVIYLSLLSRIRDNRWLKCVIRQSQQYWHRRLKAWGSRFYTVVKPATETIASFFSEKIFLMTEHREPLHL